MVEIKKELLVPKKRLASLLKSKDKLEKDLDISIDNEENLVFIESDDGLSLLIAQNIIKAIARGFDVKTAMQLEKEENTFNTIKIAEDKKHLIRIKARLIGTNGVVKKKLEELTNTNISIYGKTISVLGNYDDVELCSRAIERLIKGQKHGPVYKYLEKR